MHESNQVSVLHQGLSISLFPSVQFFRMQFKMQPTHQCNHLHTPALWSRTNAIYSRTTRTQDAVSWLWLCGCACSRVCVFLVLVNLFAILSCCFKDAFSHLILLLRRRQHYSFSNASSTLDFVDVHMWFGVRELWDVTISIVNVWNGILVFGIFSHFLWKTMTLHCVSMIERRTNENGKQNLIVNQYARLMFSYEDLPISCEQSHSRPFTIYILPVHLQTKISCSHRCCCCCSFHPSNQPTNQIHATEHAGSYTHLHPHTCRPVFFVCLSHDCCIGFTIGFIVLCIYGRQLRIHCDCAMFHSLCS